MAGLTAMLRMAKVVINPVVDLKVKKEANIQHADQPQVHAKKKAKVNHGAKKVQRERGMSQCK